MDPFALSGHMVWRHYWPADDIDELSADDLTALHDDEHQAGFPPHVHDWEVA